jgi:hypothetical protein
MDIWTFDIDIGRRTFDFGHWTFDIGHWTMPFRGGVAQMVRAWDS